MNNITVLIIEDDFRVAEINKKHVENIDGYTVLKTAKTGEDALTYLKNCSTCPELIMLDIYIPDVKGMELFWNIRKSYADIDMIVVTAANEANTVEQALRGGVYDYIIKPVDIDRISESLIKYKDYRKFFTAKDTLTQQEIDTITGITSVSSFDKKEKGYPKGIDPITLKEIKEILVNYTKLGITAVELSKQIGTSRSTARRYLEYLVSENEVYTVLKYGTVGRPEREYIYCETYEQNE